MDGIMPAPGSTDADFLLRVSWPSWKGDAKGSDFHSPRIYGAALNSQDNDDVLARSLLVNVASAHPWKEPLDRPFPVELSAPKAGSLPIPWGHGIMQVVHNKAYVYADSDVYVLISRMPEMTLVCDKDGVIPQCQQTFDFHHLVIGVDYPRRRVESWFEIMTDVKKKLESFLKQ